MGLDDVYKIEHSASSSDKVKNEWNCTSTLPLCLHGMGKDTLTFYLHHLIMTLVLSNMPHDCHYVANINGIRAMKGDTLLVAKAVFLNAIADYFSTFQVKVHRLLD